MQKKEPNHTKKSPIGSQQRDISGHDSARLQALLSSIGEGVITTNENGAINRINQTALDLLGIRHSEAIHKHFLEVVVPVYDNGNIINVFDRPIVKALQTGKPVSQRVNYLLKHNAILPVQTTISPIVMHGKPIGAVEVFRDLTAEIESDKLKSDFISIASHQLRTPLSAINMYTRMLQDGLAGDLTPEQKPYIETVLTSVKRMNTLISTLLNITRIEAGGIVIKKQRVYADELSREILAEFTPAAQAKSITLVADLPTHIAPIRTDSVLVKEICANLLSNAIKYTPKGGTVTFSLASTDKEVTWCIIDTGYGIPEIDQKNIFLKFFRASNIVSKDVSGTGLGLYLIKNIAESIGGDVWFESTENVGSTFCFSMPLTSA